MARLTPEQLRSRLKMDYQVAVRMRNPFTNVTAYRNVDDLKARRNPIVSSDEGHLATHYIVDYRIRTLVAPDEYSDRTSVEFDLLANGNYPYTFPGCFVISGKLPWTPHFREGVPICIDHDMWQDSRGKMLLGDLIVHVAKLLNFDEIPRTENYGGLNPAAADYWRTKLNKQPITPDYPYPTLPPIVDELTLFSPAPVQSSTMFQAKQLDLELFQPKRASRSDVLVSENEMFRAKPRDTQL